MTIAFDLAKTDLVNVSVYNVTGSIVAVLNNSTLQKGQHNIVWEANDLPAGYYFYSIQTSESAVVKKVSKIK
jgi:flagellar hook assembly protein FlgD